MRAAGNQRTHESLFGVEGFGIDLFQCLPADIVVAVSRRSQKAFFGDAAFLHGMDDLQRIGFGDRIDRVEAFF